MGALGCRYSVRGKGARLTLTLSDEGANINKIFTTFKQKTKNSGWLTGDEPVLGGPPTASDKPSAQTQWQIRFVVMKGSKLIQFYY